MNLLVDALGECGRRVVGLPTFVDKFREHPISPLGGQRDRSDCVSNLFGNPLLPHERLRAIPLHPLGAMEIIVTLLGLRGDEATALPAAEHAPVEVWLERRRLWLALVRHDRLHRVEERLSDDRLVLPGIGLAAVVDKPAVNRVLQDAMDLAAEDGFAISRGQSQVLERLGDGINCVTARGEELEGFAEERRPPRVLDDDLALAVVEVPDRGDHGPDAVLELLTLAALDVLRQVIDVILAHAEEHRERQLSLAVRLEVDGGKLQVLDRAGVKEVDDPSAIEHVAGETVRVPGEDAAGLAAFDSRKHLVEDWASGFLRALLFHQHVDDCKAATGREFADLCQLIFDRPDLAVFVVGRLPGVNEKCGGLHVPSVARLRTSAKRKVGAFLWKNDESARSARTAAGNNGAEKGRKG